MAICCNRRLGVNSTQFTRHLSLVFARTCNGLSHDIGSSLSSTLALHSSFVSPIFHFILGNFDFYLFFVHVVVAGARTTVHFDQ